MKGPSARSGHTMTYDANRKVTVLFGGHVLGSTGKFSDTWEWDGYLWTQKTPTSRPTGRTETAMAYDAKNKKSILFGGHDGQRTLSDTWQWDGFVWKRLSPTNNPSPRSDHAMSYDSARGVIVLFGGVNSSTKLQDTWEWNGTTWIDKKVPTTKSPQQRYNHAMAYDAERKQTLLYGGESLSNSEMTWQWSGVAWTKRSPSLFPRGKVSHAMAYDSTRHRIVLFGGGNSRDLYNSVYEWDGGEWSVGNTKVSPARRLGMAMAYDSNRRRLVIFGGSTRSGVAGDTWELVHDCFCVGLGHPGGGLPITCASPPVIGSTFRVVFSAPQGRGTLYVGPAPVSGPILKLAPPTTCAPGDFYPFPLLAIPGVGKPVVLSLPIPNSSSLAGVRVTFQAVVPQFSGCLSLTDAVEATIRHR
jgi:hypothetical protein